MSSVVCFNLRKFFSKDLNGDSPAGLDPKAALAEEELFISPDKPSVRFLGSVKNTELLHFSFSAISALIPSLVFTEELIID